MTHGSTDHSPKSKSQFDRVDFVEHLEQKVKDLTHERNSIKGRTESERQQRIVLDARIHDYKIWIKEFGE